MEQSEPQRSQGLRPIISPNVACASTAIPPKIAALLGMSATGEYLYAGQGKHEQEFHEMPDPLPQNARGNCAVGRGYGALLT
jgi:hypothetical protein